MITVDYSQVANLELGRGDPTLSMLAPVAEVLNVSVATARGRLVNLLVICEPTYNFTNLDFYACRIKDQA
jgi:transcriptional regulator with XRE-family HTH domain